MPPTNYTWQRFLCKVHLTAPGARDVTLRGMEIRAVWPLVCRLGEQGAGS